MESIISDFSISSEKTILQLKEDLKSIRTGRANAAILENLMVETYGGQTKLRLLELATITTEGPQALIVMPFDPSTTADIERSILKSPLSLSPVVQGTKITVRIPPLSQEQREKMKKLINQMVEEKRNQLRQARDESRKKIKIQFEAKTLTEDDKFRMEKEIDTLNQKNMTVIQEIKDKKEAEIMQV